MPATSRGSDLGVYFARSRVGVKVGSILLFLFNRPHLFNCSSSWPAKFAAVLEPLFYLDIVERIFPDGLSQSAHM